MSQVSDMFQALVHGLYYCTDSVNFQDYSNDVLQQFELEMKSLGQKKIKMFHEN
jgi:hypothetical protein